MKKFIWILLIFLAGCGPWLQVGGLYTSRGHNVSAEFPEKWMRRNISDYILITRDGLSLQYMLIETVHVDDGLKHTKKRFKPGMLSQEVAQVILDNKSSNPEVLNFKVLKNGPAKINGHSGFKATYTYKNKDGLRLKGIYYGFLQGDRFYGISYTAAARHYFDKDLKTFEKVVESFKLLQSA